MARTYSLKSVCNDHGQPVALAKCVAYNADDPDALVLAETQYTDENGNAEFTALPDTGQIDINIVWGVTHNYWLYDVSDVTGATIQDAVDKRHSQNTDTKHGVQTANMDMGFQRVINASPPINTRDYATKGYVDLMLTDPSVGMDAFYYVNIPTGKGLWMDNDTDLGQLFVDATDAADPSTTGVPVIQGFKYDSGLYVYYI